MALPKAKERHIYDAKLPSGKVIRIVPWIVKEEQEFMYATEGLKDKDEKLKHVEQLVSKCVIDEIDLSELSESEFLFLCIELRKRSKGSEHDIVFKCGKCETINDGLTLNLDEDVKIKKFDSNPIEIDDIEYTFKEITRKELDRISKIKSQEERRFEYFIASLKSVSDDEQVYTKFSIDEARKWFGEKDPESFKKLTKDFTTHLSGIAVESVFECKKCKQKLRVFVDNVLDFFV
jgi:hypothetical protein